MDESAERSAQDDRDPVVRAFDYAIDLGVLSLGVIVGVTVSTFYDGYVTSLFVALVTAVLTFVVVHGLLDVAG